MLRFCILFLEGNWAYNTNIFISIKSLEPKNAILSKGIFLSNCVKKANFIIIWCPYSSRVGEPLSLYILKTSNFRLCVKQNVPTYGALSTKNFCSKSNTFWDISSQSLQIASGTPCSPVIRESPDNFAKNCFGKPPSKKWFMWFMDWNQKLNGIVLRKGKLLFLEKVFFKKKNLYIIKIELCKWTFKNKAKICKYIPNISKLMIRYIQM